MELIKSIQNGSFMKGIVIIVILLICDLIFNQFQATTKGFSSLLKTLKASFILSISYNLKSCAI